MITKVSGHRYLATSLSALYYPSPRSNLGQFPGLQCRSASILSFLSDNRSAYNKRIRVGRGPSSGYGKTSGRGHKGQKQHGKVPFGFEGGQTPIEIVHGKRGFKNTFSVDLTTLPISRIQSWIAQGRLSPDHPITVRELVRSNCISMPKDGVKLLSSSMRHDASLDAQPELTQPLHIVVSRASASAIAAVEKAGGRVTTRYYTSWAIRKIVQGKMDPMKSLRTENVQLQLTEPEEPLKLEGNELETTEAMANLTIGEPLQEAPAYEYRLPDATSRKAIEYYRDPAHRGYLSYTVEKGHGPSLFFKPPHMTRKVEKGVDSTSGSGKKVKIEDNRLW